MKKYNLESLEKFTSQVRRDIVRMVHAQNSGHPGGSLGCVEYFTAIYKVIMNHSSNFSMDGKNEDLFFLSNGHISPVFYSVLARTGYFPVKELNTFRKIDSRLQGHPTTHEGLPGVRVASGSLGQGLSVAIGAATTKKLNKDTSLVYTLHGDGELQEGQIWEAALYASAKKVDNLISTIDFNGRQIDGDVDDVLSLGNLEEKWNAFGWKTLSCNGNNLQEMIATLETAISLTGKKQPIMIIMKTEMGYGIDYMMGSHKWHGVAPNDDQLEIALNQQVESLGDY
ncbi:MAG: transketolase [Flavobacteriales bacterium]|nr:transketolase [Flavobacteriales bacterium]MBL6869304.1 transketolase [Flavobacteriales bacterium]